MKNNVLNSKLRTIKLNNKFSRIKTINPSISFSHGTAFIHNFSKFQELDIKSDLDIKIPMNIDIRILKEGENRDGIIDRNDLETSLVGWSNIPIIDFHDMSDMSGPTKHKLADRKGYTLSNPRLEYVDNKMWIVCPSEIHNRDFAYQLYLRAKRNKPLEASAEYKSRMSFFGEGRHQTHIHPHIITLLDKGHIQGNSIKITSEQ